MKGVNEEERTGGAKVFVSKLLSFEIRFRCGACNQKLQVNMRWAGMILDCPVCRALTKVPESSGAIAQSHAAPRPTDYLAQLTRQEVELLSAVPDDDESERRSVRS